jgi:hypothetical protein
MPDKPGDRRSPAFLRNRKREDREIPPLVGTTAWTQEARGAVAEAELALGRGDIVDQRSSANPTANSKRVSSPAWQPW